MNYAQHTPGPWTACLSTLDGSVMAFHIAASPYGSTKPLCESRIAFDGKTLAANARLIAAAPDMLAALKWLVLRMEREGIAESNVPNANAVKEARTAIAKAEGRSE